MRTRVVMLLLLIFVQAGAQAFAAGETDVFSDTEALLPPLQKWSGPSETLIVAADDEWITPAECMDLSATPDYDETMAWFFNLAG